MKQINCFIAFKDAAQTRETVENLLKSATVNKVYLLATEPTNETVPGCEMLFIDAMNSSATVRKIAEKSDTEYSLIYTKFTTLEPGQYALERFLRVANDTRAGLVYSDYYQIADGVRSNLPVIDYQQGSLRDDFNFGSVLFYKASCLKKAAEETTQEYKFAGLYNLRLKVSEYAELFHMNEYLYSEVESDTRKSGEKIFD